jgi:hypothetical protein
VGYASTLLLCFHGIFRRDLYFIFSEGRRKSVLLVPDTNLVCCLTKAVYLFVACILKSTRMAAWGGLPLIFEAALEIKKILQQLRHRQLPCFVTCHKLHVHTDVCTPTLFSTQTCCYVTVLIREWRNRQHNCVWLCNAHVIEYENYSLLGCKAVQIGRQAPNVPQKPTASLKVITESTIVGKDKAAAFCEMDFILNK